MEPPEDASQSQSGDRPPGTFEPPPEDASQSQPGDRPPGIVEPEVLLIRLERRKHTIPYVAGDTVLEATRRGGLRPPFSCEQGNCATCMAHLDDGSVAMRANNVLSTDDLDEGWILTCQSVPTSATLAVDYDA